MPSSCEMFVYSMETLKVTIRQLRGIRGKLLHLVKNICGILNIGWKLEHA